MIKYYTCPVAYDPEFLGYYPKIHDKHAHKSWRASLPSITEGKDRGKPKNDVVLIAVDAEDHSVYADDVTINEIVLKDVEQTALSLDGKSKDVGVISGITE